VFLSGSVKKWPYSRGSQYKERTLWFKLTFGRNSLILPLLDQCHDRTILYFAVFFCGDVLRAKLCPISHSFISFFGTHNHYKLHIPMVQLQKDKGNSLKNSIGFSGPRWYHPKD
jgi:hypothetical protein